MTSKSFCVVFLLVTIHVVIYSRTYLLQKGNAVLRTIEIFQSFFQCLSKLYQPFCQKQSEMYVAAIHVTDYCNNSSISIFFFKRIGSLKSPGVSAIHQINSIR